MNIKNSVLDYLRYINSRTGTVTCENELKRSYLKNGMISAWKKKEKMKKKKKKKKKKMMNKNMMMKKKKKKKKGKTRNSCMQEATTGMREKGINSMEWIDREWKRKIKLHAQKDVKTLILCT